MPTNILSGDGSCVQQPHAELRTTFNGVEHPLSTPEARIHQFLGIKYASIPARFRQSQLVTVYPPITDASKVGPICPQPNNSQPVEELLFGLPEDCLPKQNLKQDEFECLNLNITCPAGLNQFSRVPILLFIHGGGHRGSGSHWAFDGGSLVRKSIKLGKPVIVVTFNFRIGFLGSAATPMIQADNEAAGDEGAGNYGLRDQQRCFEWVHKNIMGFGGDPENITLFGASSGAADIVCHLLSKSNETNPIFARAIVQSPVFEQILPDVSTAGWQLSRIMSALQASDMEKLRALDVKKLLGLGPNFRVIDDGVFFREGWMDYFSHTHSGRSRSYHRHDSKAHPRTSASLLRPPVIHPHHHHQHVAHSHHGTSSTSRSRSSPRVASGSSSRSQTRPSSNYSTPRTFDNLQPIIIGDSSSDSLLWSLSASLWTSASAVRRIKAICQSLTKASGLLRAYDLSTSVSDKESVDHVLELVNDARVAWPTECIAQNARRERGGQGVWRYVFDQEGPCRGIPHHAADLMYLFDIAPESVISQNTELLNQKDVFFDGPFSDSDDEDTPPPTPLRLDEEGSEEEGEWETAIVDEFAYNHVKDAIQSKWISFAHGQAPWGEDKIFVFGPEGETGERSPAIFEGRRRKELWTSTLEPLGHQLVSKIGFELSRGPC